MKNGVCEKILTMLTKAPDSGLEKFCLDLAQNLPYGDSLGTALESTGRTSTKTQPGKLECQEMAPVEDGKDWA